MKEYKMNGVKPIHTKLLDQKLGNNFSIQNDQEEFLKQERLKAKKKEKIVHT